MRNNAHFTVQENEPEEDDMVSGTKSYIWTIKSHLKKQGVRSEPVTNFSRAVNFFQDIIPQHKKIYKKKILNH